VWKKIGKAELTPLVKTNLQNRLPKSGHSPSTATDPLLSLTNDRYPAINSVGLISLTDTKLPFGIPKNSINYFGGSFEPLSTAELGWLRDFYMTVR